MQYSIPIPRGIGVGLYLTCTPEGCYHVALSSKANIIVVENDSQLEKVLQVSQYLEKDYY